jgi:hypothetical protein
MIAKHVIFSSLAAAALAVIASSCASPDPNAREHATLPDEGQFQPVADMLIHRCGSLDCHGTLARNLKIYGVAGLRSAAGDVPSPMAPDGGDSSADEYHADYRSVCGLEPEVMSAVVKDGGKNPERLTLVQKPRATQDHKGGKIIQIGDDQDKCLLSWLSGTTDVASCKASLQLP